MGRAPSGCRFRVGRGPSAGRIAFRGRKDEGFMTLVRHERLVRIAPGIGSLVGRAVALAQAGQPARGFAVLEQNRRAEWLATGSTRFSSLLTDYGKRSIFASNRQSWPHGVSAPVFENADESTRRIPRFANETQK